MIVGLWKFRTRSAKMMKSKEKGLRYVVGRLLLVNLLNIIIFHQQANISLIK